MIASLLVNKKGPFRLIFYTSLAFFAKKSADFVQNIVDNEMKLRYYYET